jgi:hypothetical protein
MPGSTTTSNVPQQILGLLRDGDLWSLLLASALLLFVGLRLTAKRRRLERLAMATGVGAFLAVIVAEFAETGFPTADSLPGLLLQALLACGFTTAVGTVVLPVLAILWEGTLAIPLRATTRTMQQARNRRQLREQERQQAIKRQRQHEQQAIENVRKQDQELRRAQQQRQLEQQQASAEQRRQRARFRVQVAFDQHRDQLLGAFSEDVLQRYFDQYMNSSEPPETVEQRGTELEQMFDAWLKRAGVAAPQQFESIADIVNSFHRQQQELQAAFASIDVPHSEAIINTLCTRLRKMQDDAIQEFLK